MEVKSVNNTGAFLEWGLMKDLLVPFKEQKMPMREGKWYLVYVHVDHVTGRIVASARIDKYLDIFCVLMCACKAPKDVIYFQGIDDLTPDELAEMSQAYTIKIENDDLLSINVTAWDPVAVTPFNPPVFAYSSQGEQPLIASESMYTYLVDEDGCINFPIIGKVHVAGLTRKKFPKNWNQRFLNM